MNFLGFLVASYGSRHLDLRLAILSPSSTARSTNTGSSEVGGPPRWTKYDDASDVHFLKEDAFDSIENVREAASNFKRLHNCECYHSDPVV